MFLIDLSIWKLKEEILKSSPDEFADITPIVDGKLNTGELKLFTQVIGDNKEDCPKRILEIYEKAMEHLRSIEGEKPAGNRRGHILTYWNGTYDRNKKLLEDKKSVKLDQLIKADLKTGNRDGRTSFEELIAHRIDLGINCHELRIYTSLRRYETPTICFLYEHGDNIREFDHSLYLLDKETYQLVKELSNAIVDRSKVE